MAPKKKVEEVVERPPEGDDERLLTVTVSFDIIAEYFTSLKSPMLSFKFPGEEQHRCEISPESLQNRYFSSTLFSKRIVVSPAFVESVLTDEMAVSLWSVPDVVRENVPQPKGKGAAAPKGGGKAPSSVLEMSADDLTFHWSLSVNFCDVLTRKEMVYSFHQLNTSDRNQPPAGISSGKLSLQLSDVLLAPSNILKYQPVIVEIAGLHHYPFQNPIPLAHTGSHPSWEDDEGTLHVQFDIFGETCRTEEVRKASTCHFGHKKVFFLFKQKKIDVIQRLAYPIEFEIREGGRSKRASNGVSRVNLSKALDGVCRFTTSGQVFPSERDSDAGAPTLDYISFGTNLKTVVQFLAPLSRPIFVNDTGALSSEGQLSRVILRMPYDGVSAVLQAVMGTLVALKRGGVESKVREFEVVQPPEGKRTGGTPIPAAAPSGTNGPVGAIRIVAPPGISGFEVMDGDIRLMCFEGPLTVVHKIAEVATCVLGDDERCAVRVNAELPFYERAYNVWPSLVIPMEERVKAPTPTIDAPKAPAGKKAPAPAPKKKSEAEVKSTTPLPQTVDDDAPPEIDAGGVGGRIRRIRLDARIDALAHNQRNFIKRALPLDALRCITKLKLLKESQSVLQAVELNLFPTAGELVALERVHGQTLELMDVCGSNNFLSFAETDVTTIVNKAARDNAAVKTSDARVVDITAVTADDIGAVISFVGIPATAKQCEGIEGLRKEDTQRFPHRANIFAMELGKTVVCAFSAPPPTQMLRHIFTAQIIKGTSGNPLIFIIDCSSMAKNSSDHINTAYDRKLRKDKRRAPANEYFSQLAAQKAHYLATHTLADAPEEESSDDESELDRAPLVDKGLEQPDLIPNYVELNKDTTSLLRGKTLASHVEPETDDFRRAVRLFERQSRRIQRAETLGHSSDPISFDAPFRTILPKTGPESRLHPLAPSAQRVDDLHCPWVPPAGYKSLKDQSHRLAFLGARDVLRDPSREKSVFGALNATQRREQEAGQREAEQKKWEERVVVADARFHVSCRPPHDQPVSSLEKLQPLLEDPPSKVSLKKVHVPAAPPSIFQHEAPTRNLRTEPSTEKHPEARKMYYSRELSHSKKPLKPVQPSERQSPLYYPSM